jgi:hypothetical protein
MSNTVRQYKTFAQMGDSYMPDASPVSVTAFIGGKYGKCVQLTTRNDYACLSEKQVKDLIKVLQWRLKGKKGYAATDWGEEKEVDP